MLGVALRNEYLTLIMGLSGCLVFLLVVTSRRDELTNLREDLQDRLTRGRQERQAAKLAWEAIQRIELSPAADAAYEIVGQTARELGCEQMLISCDGDGTGPALEMPGCDAAFARGAGPSLSGASAIFRFSGGPSRWITIRLALPDDPPLAADIVFRYLQRLGQALAERFERLESSSNSASDDVVQHDAGSLLAGGSVRKTLGFFTSVGERFVAGIMRAPGLKRVSSSNRSAAEAFARPRTGTRV